MFEPHFKDLATWTPKQMIGKGFPVQMPRHVRIKKGQVLKAGSILGRGANNKYVLCAASDEEGNPISDGSEKPRVVLSTDINTTAEEKEAVVYRTGSFLREKVILGKGHTAESVEDQLEDRNIYFEESTY